MYRCAHPPRRPPLYLYLWEDCAEDCTKSLSRVDSAHTHTPAKKEYIYIYISSSQTKRETHIERAPEKSLRRWRARSIDKMAFFFFYIDVVSFFQGIFFLLLLYGRGNVFYPFLTSSSFANSVSLSLSLDLLAGPQTRRSRPERRGDGKSLFKSKAHTHRVKGTSAASIYFLPSFQLWYENSLNTIW